MKSGQIIDNRCIFLVMFCLNIVGNNFVNFSHFSASLSFSSVVLLDFLKLLFVFEYGSVWNMLQFQPPPHQHGRYYSCWDTGYHVNNQILYSVFQYQKLFMTITINPEPHNSPPNYKRTFAAKCAYCRFSSIQPPVHSLSFPCELPLDPIWSNQPNQ